LNRELKPEWPLIRVSSCSENMIAQLPGKFFGYPFGDIYLGEKEYIIPNPN